MTSYGVEVGGVLGFGMAWSGTMVSYPMVRVVFHHVANLEWCRW